MTAGFATMSLRRVSCSEPGEVGSTGMLVAILLKVSQHNAQPRSDVRQARDDS